MFKVPVRSFDSSLIVNTSVDIAALVEFDTCFNAVVDYLLAM